MSIVVLYTPHKSPSSGDWREHDQNVYDLCCQIDRDARPTVIILHFNHADDAAYHYIPRHIMRTQQNVTLFYRLLLLIW